MCRIAGLFLLFWWKNFAGRSPKGPCSCTTMPRLTGHLQPRKKLVYLGFQCLDHPPYSPNLAPSEYHLFPELKKTIESSDAEVIAAAETWLDGQRSDFFFQWLEVYWASWKVCWINPEFGRCSLFPSWLGSGLTSTLSCCYNTCSK